MSPSDGHGSIKFSWNWLRYLPGFIRWFFSSNIFSFPVILSSRATVTASLLLTIVAGRPINYPSYSLLIRIFTGSSLIFYELSKYSVKILLDFDVVLFPYEVLWIHFFRDFVCNADPETWCINTGMYAYYYYTLPMWQRVQLETTLFSQYLYYSSEKNDGKI